MFSIVLKIGGHSWNSIRQINKYLHTHTLTKEHILTTLSQIFTYNLKENRRHLGRKQYFFYSRSGSTIKFTKITCFPGKSILLGVLQYNEFRCCDLLKLYFLILTIFFMKISHIQPATGTYEDWSPCSLI